MSTPVCVCPHCGAPLPIDYEKETVVCKYCDARLSLSAVLGETAMDRDMRRKHISREKERAIKAEIEKEKIKEQTRLNDLQEKALESRKFRHSLRGALLIFVAVLLLIAACGDLLSSDFASALKFSLAGGMMLLSWLIGAKYVKGKPLTRVLLWVSALLLLLFMNTAKNGSGLSHKSDPIDWSAVILAEHLPKPALDRGEISINSDRSLWVYLIPAAESDYAAYRDACVAKGYTIESETTKNGYRAFAESGHRLHLAYYDSDKSYILIELDAPHQMAENTWPKSPMASRLPAPPTSIGYLAYDSENSFHYYAGGMTREDFSRYADKLFETGYTGEYEKLENYFSGISKDGCKAQVSYEGNKVVSISLDLNPGG